PWPRPWRSGRTRRAPWKADCYTVSTSRPPVRCHPNHERDLPRRFDSVATVVDDEAAIGSFTEVGPLSLRRAMLTDERLEPPLAVSFDLDGTLLDGSHLGTTVADTCRAIAARKPDLDADELTSANSRIWEEYFPMIEDDWALGVIDSQTAGREASRRTLQACGVSDDQLVEFARQTF